MLEVSGSLEEPRFRKDIAVLMQNQVIDDLFVIRVKAIIERITAESTEYCNGLVNLSSNSVIFKDRVTAWLLIIAKITIAIRATTPIRMSFPVSAGGGPSSFDELYKINVRYKLEN